MEINEAIYNRRSIGAMKQDPLSKEIIEKLLEAAVCAPNHHRSEPWRFMVMSGAGRNLLGKAYADVAAESMDDPSTEENQLLLKKQQDKALRAPVIIAVTAAPSSDPKVDRREELAAVHAAVQNMLLTAHSLGIGSIWRTGEPAYHRIMKAAFGLRESDEIVGFVYLGYPSISPATLNRPNFQEKTTWYE